MTRRAATSEGTTGFASLGLDKRLLTALAALGYEEPTPVQSAAIPPLLLGRDVLAQAATGTGKTAAFALPLLHVLTPKAKAKERTTALILVPTRELAMQVAEAVHRYGKEMGAVSLPVYGGASMENQVRALQRGVDVVVATPGRARDHIRRGTLHLASVKVVVLDEADEMLDMGFAEDLEAILDATPALRQTALFAATIPPRIASIAAKRLRNPVKITIDLERVPSGTAARVRQVAYIVIHTGPSTKQLADGRNTHLIQRGKEWWRKQLGKHFEIPSNGFIEKPPLIYVVAAPKKTGNKPMIGEKRAA
jgi:ATP-dependent RNA helicase DeaD